MSDPSKSGGARAVRRAALTIFIGLLVQLGCTLYWRPITFVVFAMVGMPLVLAGIGIYARTVWLSLREKELV